MSDKEVVRQEEVPAVEEDVNTVVEEVDSEQEQPVVEQDSPEDVAEAQKYGHLSEQEYLAKHGSLKGYKSAKEFNRFGKEVYPEIDRLKQQIEYLVDEQKKNTERAYYVAKQELANKLQYAEETGDIKAALKFKEDQIKLELEQSRTTQQTNVDENKKTLDYFVDKNKHWYAADVTGNPLNDLTREAQQIGMALYQSGTSYHKMFQEIEQIMEYRHPEIRKVNTVQPPRMGAAKSSVNKSVSKSYKMSSEDEFDYNVIKKVYKEIHGKDYTEQDYLYHKNNPTTHKEE